MLKWFSRRAAQPALARNALPPAPNSNPEVRVGREAQVWPPRPEDIEVRELTWDEYARLLSPSREAGSGL